jgi:uncharacterized membrane protein YgcG
VSHEDIFYALMGVVVSAAPGLALDGTPAGEQQATALHCLLTLLDYVPQRSESTAAAAAAPVVAVHADVRWGSSFGGWFGGGEAATSASTASAMAAGPPLPSSGATGLGAPTSVLSNMYGRMLQGISAQSGNLEPLHQSLLALVRSGLAGSSGSALSYVTMGALGVPGASSGWSPACHQEAAVLTLHALRCNDAFFNLVISPAARSGLPLAFTLLALVMKHRDDPTKGGFLQCASFIVLRLSAARNFAIALNAAASSHAPLGAFSSDPNGVPVAAFELPDAFRGTHADVFIHVCFALLTECDPTWVAPLISPLLTALHNVAPYWKNVSAMGAERLIAMVEHFADPAVLYSHPEAYQNLAMALHPVNRCLQHQPESNPALVYAVLRLGDVFDRIDAMGVAPLEQEDDDEVSRSARGRGREGGVEAGRNSGGHNAGEDKEAVDGEEEEEEVEEEEGSGASTSSSSSGSSDEGRGIRGGGGGCDGGGGGGGGGFVPTREWLEKVRGEMPLLLSLQLRRVLTPMVEDFCTSAVVVSEQHVHTYITGQSIADLLPPPQPITVRRFTESPGIRTWLRNYTMVGVREWRPRQRSMYGKGSMPG